MNLNDQDSMEKQRINARAGSIVFDSKLSLADFLKEVQKITRKAKRDGYKDLTVDGGYDNGDEDTLPSSFFQVFGNRLETEEEWHKRLEDIRRHNQNTLENAQRIMDRKENFLKRIVEVDTALDKSSLKCVDCGSPHSHLESGGGLKKETRLCGPCSNKRRDEYMKKIK